MARQKITTKKTSPSKEQKIERLKRNYTEWNGNEISIEHAYSKFIMSQIAKGNSKPTIQFYDRFYKKLKIFIETYLHTIPSQCPVDILVQDGMQVFFTTSLGDKVNQQTINSYLRGYRSFGNYCEEIGLIDGFKCPIKEVQPPVKQVYTGKELEKLMVKPSVDDFVNYRTYMILSLILATGARTDTLINIKIEDVDLEEGYITFNTLKAKRVLRLGLERKLRKDLNEYITNWRTGIDVLPSDYLFCNSYGEKLSRNGFWRAISVYNKRRGVDKTSVHLLRHTFAKNWLTSGGDMITLAQVLNHSELEMVKRYANLYATDVKAEIQQHSILSQMRRKSGKTLKTMKLSNDEY